MAVSRSEMQDAKHAVERSDVSSTLSGPSERLTCKCGWSGHSTLWHDHDSDVPPLPPTPPPPPAPRDVLRRAIYGDRPRLRYR